MKICCVRNAEKTLDIHYFLNYKIYMRTPEEIEYDVDKELFGEGIADRMHLEQEADEQEGFIMDEFALADLENEERKIEEYLI